MIAMLLCFAAAPPVPFGPVRDNVGLFGATALRDADARLGALKKRYGFEMRLETLDKQPAMNDIAGILYKHVREERLRSWVRDRARAAGLDKGLYVVISKDPRDVRLAGWPSDTEGRFKWSRREEVRAGMQRYLSTDPDRALSEAVTRFTDLLEETRDSPSPFATLPLLATVGGLAGAWLVLCVVRRRVGRADAPLYPPAVQGGLFGTPAASWIYDRLFQGATKR